ncbi:MAG: penicillin-binding transpeptidase domain-containing protein [Mariprofundales bacterium]|nr:penicillin-binding transpeptidase domain-containing protein [Mariprofundales bacterium]
MGGEGERLIRNRQLNRGGRAPLLAAGDRFFRRRVMVVVGFMSLGFLLLIVRMVDLQWIQSDELMQRAEKQRLREFHVMAPRGAISDRQGAVLAESLRIPSIAAFAEQVPEERYDDLARALQRSPRWVRGKLAKRRGFVWLRRQAPPKVAAAVMALQIPGLREEDEWQRFQPFGSEAGQILGFVGIDGNGLEGVEYSLNSHLRGIPGVRRVERDGKGGLLPGSEWLKLPQPGLAVRLTIDSTIQSIAYTALARGVRANGAKAGAVVVLDPNTMDVLAMANWPSFNPNNFRKFKPSQWRNRAVTDRFEPGSTLKPFTMAAALASGKWSPKSVIYCENGRYRVANYTIHDDHPMAWLDMSGVISHSSNIGSAKLALDIGAEPLYAMLMRVGFGERAQIGLPGESPGRLLPVRRWGPVETANIAFGQGVAVTPLQLASAFAVLANRGVYRSPRILLDPEPLRDDPRQVMEPYIADTVLAMLHKATSREGTGFKAVPLGYSVAGKTGTAQKPNRHGKYDRKHYTAVFAGITPVEKPALVIMVMVDDPQKSIYGGSVAAPIFRHIAEQALPHLGVAPLLLAQQRKRQRAQRSQHQMRRVAFADREGVLLSLNHRSLREVRQITERLHWQLRTHGTGWVYKQKPASLAAVAAGGQVEVWLRE